MEHSYSETLCTAMTGPLSAGLTNLDELLPIECQQLLEEAAAAAAQFEAECNIRPSKSVSFGTDSVTYIESCVEIPQCQRDQVWFRRSELDYFKNSAKKLCKLSHKGMKVEAQSSIRGMDVYYPARQRAHSKFIYHLLQAYHVKCDRNSEYVGQLAESWSAKAKERALVTGIQDFYEAYFPHMVQTPMPEVAANTTRKRTSTECEPAPRRD
jgi:hypothetical protein